MAFILSPVLTSQSLRIDSPILISAYSLNLPTLQGTDVHLITGVTTVTFSVPQPPSWVLKGLNDEGCLASCPRNLVCIRGEGCVNLWVLISSVEILAWVERGAPKALAPGEELWQLMDAEGGRATLLWECGRQQAAQTPMDGCTPMCIWASSTCTQGIINNNKQIDHEAGREAGGCSSGSQRELTMDRL